MTAPPENKRPIDALLEIMAWPGDLEHGCPLGSRAEFCTPIVALAFRFGLVAAEDVARRADLDLFDEELGPPRTRSTSSGVSGVSFSCTSQRTTALLR